MSAHSSDLDPGPQRGAPAEARQPLPALAFDNSFVRALPGDPSQVNRPRQVFGACYSKVAPTPVARPRLVAHAREVAALLGLPAEAFEGDALAEVLGGNRLMPGMEPYAACYGGHQFGSWAGQLGDGRAISLGEAIGPGGARWELQLKGAGRTPYSRSGDGRAVMRSSLREFLCSEAMHHLGVPTTRALSLVATGDSVVRDMLYDGNPRPEPGAIVCRVAPSFVRFGNFELPAVRGETAILRALADYVIETHYPELGPPSKETYVRWFAEVGRRTALMIVHWMRVGFVHGVMNTDNMSILGLTIDYGPYGWLEGYDPGWTPNTTDAGGRRYRYGNQPRVALWNLVQLANALIPLTDSPEPLEEALGVYAETYDRERRAMMAAKLGISARPPVTDDGPGPDDALVGELFEVLGIVETDMTIFFRRLADVRTDEAAAALPDEALMEPLLEAYYAPDELEPAHRARVAAWLRAWGARVRQDGTPDAERRARMNAVNPKYVLRNYVAQLAIDEAEKGESGKVYELLDVLRRPYDEQPGKEAYAEKRPEWARHRAGCSMLSCSS